MKTILEIIEASGRLRDVKSISIQNEPWMRLVIEVLSERGPDGRLVVSVAHYSEQNSDPMRDPEMLFEVMGMTARDSRFGPSIFATITSAWSSGAVIAARAVKWCACQAGLAT